MDKLLICMFVLAIWGCISTVSKDQNKIPASEKNTISTTFIEPTTLSESESISDGLFNKLGDSLHSLFKFRSDRRGVVRMFYEEEGYGFYYLLQIESKTKNQEAVRAAAEAMMCDFADGSSLILYRANVASLTAVIPEEKRADVIDAESLLANYDLEVARGIHSILEKTMLADDLSSLYLLAYPSPIFRHHGSVINERAIEGLVAENKVIVLSLDSYTPREIANVFDTLRLQFLKHEVDVPESKLVSSAESLRENPVSLYFRRILNLIPEFIGQARAADQVCP